MPTNPSIERARLFAFLYAENPTTLPVRVATAGEIQLVVTSPEGERKLVQLQSRRTYELLNIAPLEWWKHKPSLRELSKALNKGWLTVPLSSGEAQGLPVASGSAQPAVQPLIEGEEQHTILLWNPSTSEPRQAPTGKARLWFDGEKLLISEDGGDYIPVAPSIDVEELGYEPALVLDFDPKIPTYRTLALDGDLTLDAENLGPGRQVALRLVGDDATRNLSFPEDWNFIGPMPSSIAPGETAILSLVSYGEDGKDVVAAYSTASLIQAKEADITGAGEIGQVAYWSGPDSITGKNSLYWDYINERLGVLSPTPEAALSVGPNSEFQVDGSGNLAKINNVPVSFPAAQGDPNTILRNDGAGNLAWTPETNDTLITLETTDTIAGDACYFSGNNLAAPATATGIQTARVMGIVDLSDGPGIGKVRVSGIHPNANFIGGLNLTAGDAVYLSKTNGKLTNNVSAFNEGDVVAEIGLVANVTDPSGGDGAADVLLLHKPIVVL